MAVDEFEIKQVCGNRSLDVGNSSRSLVFKISKRINKEQQDITTYSEVALDNSKLKEELVHLKSNQYLSPEAKVEDNISIKNLNEVGAAADAACPMRPVGHITENFGPALRRASKRIVLRVRKPNFQVNDKISIVKKTTDSTRETTKQGSIYCKMGRRKGVRKNLPTAANPKPEFVRRGRGRPRKNRGQPLEKTKKIISIKSSKPTKKPLPMINHTESSSVWTLVPKEFINSDYFKSHIIKMQERRPRGRHPKKALGASFASEISHLTFSNHEKIKVQFPKKSPVPKISTIQQNPVPIPTPSPRPTVIYFKTQTNNLGKRLVNSPFLIPNQQKVQSFSSEEFRPSSYLQQNCGSDVSLGYDYGHSQLNQKRNGHGIKYANPVRTQFTAECNTYSDQQYCLQDNLPISQECKVEHSNEFIPQRCGYERISESPPLENSSDVPYYKVIADAIRILCDEESVLG